MSEVMTECSCRSDQIRAHERFLCHDGEKQDENVLLSSETCACGAVPPVEPDIEEIRSEVRMDAGADRQRWISSVDHKLTWSPESLSEQEKSTDKEKIMTSDYTINIFSLFQQNLHLQYRVRVNTTKMRVHFFQVYINK